MEGIQVNGTIKAPDDTEYDVHYEVEDGYVHLNSGVEEISIPATLWQELLIEVEDALQRAGG